MFFSLIILRNVFIEACSCVRPKTNSLYLICCKGERVLFVVFCWMTLFDFVSSVIWDIGISFGIQLEVHLKLDVQGQGVEKFWTKMDSLGGRSWKLDNFHGRFMCFLNLFCYQKDQTSSQDSIFTNSWIGLLLKNFSLWGSLKIYISIL